MSLNLTSPVLSRLFHPPSPLTPKLTPRPNNLALLSLLLSSPSLKPSFVPKTSLSSENSNSITESLILTHQDLLTKVSSAQDATEALQLISDITGKSSGIVSVSDCCAIITSAIERNNADLALSVFYSMRSSFDQDNINGQCKWSRPDVSVYTVLVQSLASALKVSDALKTVDYICRVGVSPGEEVPFGKVVRCPNCIIAIAVAQPQNGVQVASCSKCRYQYELVSGDIVSINSEEISKDLPAWEKALRFLQLLKKSVPAAVHSIVVQTPSGTARTHRFAPETVDLPAQEGERVTIASAAPSNVYRNVGPFKFSPKSPNTYPGEPLSLTNHENGRESKLLRPPVKDENFSLLNPSVLIPLLAVLATGDAATGIIDPSLPQLISVAAIASIGAGTTLNSLVLPQLNQLPQKSVDIVAIRQQLLSQYDMLQSRINDLKESAEKEVWMLARMCQLENKIFAVGEPSYRARRTKVKRVREGLENSLKGQIELIDSYARISSMIEIEVEMDFDVLAAEAIGNVEIIAEQIQQIMEIENLEERWRLQAEANDEAERLLSSQPLPTEKV